MLKVALPENGVTDKALRTSVATIMKVDEAKVTHQNIVELLAK